MKTSDLKQTAFVGIVATAALGVGTTFTQTTASADSLETPVVNAGTNQISVTHAEPTNLAEANATLKQVEHSYQDATVELTNAQTTLNATINAQNQAVEASNRNIKATNDVNTQLEAKVTELSEAKSDTAKAQADSNTAEQNLNQEVAKNPTAEADLNQAETDAQKANQAKVVAENHEADVRKELERADKSATNLKNNLSTEQNIVDKLTKNVKDLTKTSTDAHSEQTSAENKLAEKQNEVDSKVIELQSNVDKQPDIITYERSDAKTLNGFDFDRGGENDGAGKTKEVVFTDGKETVNIDLTPEQQLDFQSTGAFTYTPNMAEVNKYLVAYINRLREINGITDKVTTDDVAQAFAQARADEMTKNDVLSHRTTLGHPHSWEAISGVIYNTNSDYFYNPHIVLSDQQFAYMELAHWFTEYRNYDSGKGSVQYGHRLTLLFSVGNVGFGATRKTGEDANVFDGYSSLDVFAYPGQGSKSEALKDVTYVNENGRLVMYFRGQRVKFLPETTFNYVSNKKIVTPSKAKLDAQAKLNLYKSQATQELKDAQSKVDETKTKSVDIDGQLAKSNAELTSHQTILDALKAELSNSYAILNNLKSKLVEATADVNAANIDKENADAKLAEVQAKNKALTDARDKYTEAINKVKSLQEKVKTLESDVKGLTETRDGLVAKQEGLDKAVATAKAKVAEAKAAYDKAKIKVDELSVAYVKAQADILKFTPKPVAKSKHGSQFVNIKYYGDSNLLYSSRDLVQSPEFKTYKTQTSTTPKYESESTSAMSVSRQTKLPSTGDESSILTTVGMAIMSLFGLLYIGKHRKNTNKEV
ncbi:LPXTG cell wall anchor domain-containing protein [Streptococcus sp.]|uniref:LPXTG cell wall anchor domain-containing protein n=1 Tax=Streptococcus sp. TaxID=1306 RepID=UPI0025FF49F4|nr:LPXTG cell wall anchor domain-containing protein [Streptococcus sp.]